mmetsp:Transcript_31068/g.49960  ORF Transcript_31068/g.49960 Transcript_31068/m.49960 type:complete len:92 (+) Transcript_31068:812-1087(+)
MRNLKMDLDDEYGETLSKLELHKNDSEMNRLKKEIAIASTHLQEKQSHLRADQRKLLGLGQKPKTECEGNNEGKSSSVIVEKRPSKVTKRI